VAEQRSTVTRPDDAELVRRAQQGDLEAFDRLIERHQRRAVSVSYRFVGNLHDALEITQEAFIRAVRNIATLQNPARFGPWLLRIVTNLSLNFRRDRAVRRRLLSLEESYGRDDGDPAQRLAAAEHSTVPPAAELDLAELHALVQAALAELPQQQRTALVLFSLEQLPQREVAEIMGCSVEAVKWHVFQARRKLRQLLADYL